MHSLTILYSVDKKKRFSRKRNNEEEGDITYINERNRVFNKKVRLHTLPPVVFHNWSVCFFRSHGTTTSIHRRFVRASSGAQRCDVSYPLFAYRSLLCNLYTCIYTHMDTTQNARIGLGSNGEERSKEMAEGTPEDDQEDAMADLQSSRWLAHVSSKLSNEDGQIEGSVLQNVVSRWTRSIRLLSLIFVIWNHHTNAPKEQGMRIEQAKNAHL